MSQNTRALMSIDSLDVYGYANMNIGYFCPKLTRAQTFIDSVDICQTKRMTQISIDSIVICRQRDANTGCFCQKLRGH
jgi:hypothetical protein